MKKQKKYSGWNMDLLPLLGVILLLPLIVRIHIENTSLGELPWLPVSMNERADFFLYGKSRVLLILAGSMILFIVDRTVVRGEKAGNMRCLLPLLGYELFTVLATIFSKTKSFALNGMVEQYEGLYVLLAYGIIAVYSYLVIRSEKDIDILFFSILTAGVIQSIFGIVEICGKEIMNTPIFKRIILGDKYQKLSDHLVFNFMGEAYQRVSGTLYNSNYAGIFFGMVLILAVCMMIKWAGWRRIYAVVVSLLSLLCLIGSGSKTAVFVIVFIFLILAIKLKVRKQRKQCVCLLIGILGIFIGYMLYDCLAGVHTIQRIMDSVMPQKDVEKLTDIQVLPDHVTFTWQEQEYFLSMEKEGNALYPHVSDEEGKEISLTSDETKQICWIKSIGADELYFQCYYKGDVAYLSMTHNGIPWLFTDVTGEYTYVNIWGKSDEIVKAPAVGFKGKEHWFTSRGYIWSRTIPLLKNNIFVGSGPDTFMLQFPQEDYVARAAQGYGFFSEIITKPHCMYLQIAVQTGIISLVFFLCLPIGTEIKYRRIKREKKQGGITYTEVIGCLISFYLLTGITNDSMLVMAPFYWMLLGMFMKRTLPPPIM